MRQRTLPETSRSEIMETPIEKKHIMTVNKVMLSVTEHDARFLFENTSDANKTYDPEFYRELAKEWPECYKIIRTAQGLKTFIQCSNNINSIKQAQIKLWTIKNKIQI